MDHSPHGKEGSGRHCHRCRNEIWKESGLYIRKKNSNEWLVFCRMDCTTLHFGAKRASQLITYEQWCTQLTHEAIKKKV